MDFYVCRLVSYEYNSGAQNFKVRNNFKTMDIGLIFYSYKRLIKSISLAKQHVPPPPVASISSFFITLNPLCSFARHGQ
jgi:hypothetical protein